MKKTSLLLFLIPLFFIFAEVVQAEPMNAGFISGIWYSTSSFYIGDKIRIYSAMQNNSGYDIIGEVHFYDGQNIIGSADFSVVDGQLVERWADWTVTPGTHNIYAKIVNPRKSEIGKDPEPITLASDASVPDMRVATIDPARLAPETNTSAPTSSENSGSNSETETASTTPPAEPSILEKLVESVKKITDLVLNKESTPTEKTTGNGTAASTTTSTTDVLNEATETSNAETSTESTSTNGITSFISQKLTAKKAALDEILNQEVRPQPVGLLAKPLASLENKFTFLKIPSEYVPSSGRIFSWFLGALIVIVNTWWLLIIISLLLLRWLWKIFRFFYFRNRD